MQKLPPSSQSSFIESNEMGVAIFASLLAVLAYLLVWHDFLSSALMFGDYGLSIPALLDQYFWVHRHGLAVQWFTPGMCGGIPAFPEPQSGQYNLLTLFIWLAGPTAGVKYAFILHAWLGFVGAYCLCRRAYGLRIDTALVAAILFMFNGFYAYRIVASHLFYGLMLTPLMAWAVLHSFDERKWPRAVSSACIVGLLFATYIYGGGLGMVVPFCLGIAVLMALNFAMRADMPPLLQVGRASLIFSIVTVALCIPKIVAAGSFLTLFPRDSYRLPGFASLPQLFKSMWLMFFTSPGDTAAAILAHVVNMQWLLDRHEWEFGVTLTPIVLILLALRNPAAFQRRPSLRKVVYAAAALLMLSIPIAINFYTPEWNQLLKHIPIIKSSSNLVRYFWVWVVFLCFWPVLFFDRFSALASRVRWPVSIFCMSLVIFTFATQDRDYYRRGSTYDPSSVEQAFDRVNSGQAEPQIRTIGVITDAQGKLVTGGDRNKSLAQGISQFYCYQPIFGYRLEKFPYGAMHPGDPFEEAEPGRLNFKNPACMVYPDDNGCKPGDAFSVTERASLHQFLHYDPFVFSLSRRQTIANAIGAAMGLLLILWFGLRLIDKIRSHRRVEP